MKAARPFLALVAALAATSLPALAHPLGNFTINHLAKLTFTPGRADVRYVLDMAEIPAFQTMGAAGLSAHPSRLALARWAAAISATLVPQLELRADGARLPLVADATSARTRPGAGGLPTLYLRIDAHAAVPRAAHTADFQDGTYAGRLGWRDLVVAPATEPTHELTAYPNALLGSPRALSAVTVNLRDGAALAVRARETADAGGSAMPSSATPLGRSNQLSDMLARGTQSWTFVVLTLLVAILLGALHALEPGHGKTLLAISLVGARATVKQAAILASGLTVAHTAGVLLLGLAINLFKGYFVPESIYPWITLLSGVAIALIGARALQRQISARAPLAHAHAHGHTHAHAHSHAHVHHAHRHESEAQHERGHEHGHEHSHDDLDHAKLHAIPGTAPLHFRTTVLAAMSGGIAPCPAAIVVLLAAVALNQVAYGVVVIVAFSLGLAATLTGLGIAVVRSAAWLQRRRGFERFVAWGPLVSAIAISVIGAVMLGQGMAQEGVSASPLAISAVAALAIAGFAFSHPFVRPVPEPAAAEGAA